MPDGDIIRGFQPIYQKPCKDLFEGKATNDECTRSLIKSFQKDIKNKGDTPIKLAKIMGESLQRAVSDAGGMIFMDWAAQRREFYKIVEQEDCPHRSKELVLRAGMSYLHDLEYRKEVDINYSSESILSQYMTEVYEAGFKEGIPPETDAAILERIKQIELTILSVIPKWAKKADAEGSVRNLQFRFIPKVKEVNNLEDDLLAVHNHNNSRKIDELLQTASNVTSQSWKHYLSIDNGEPI